MNFPSRNKILGIIVALHANGNSSYRDANNLSKLIVENWKGSKCVIISDKKNVGENYVRNKDDFLEILSNTVKKYSDSYDILFTISAHGYTYGKDQYIRVGRDIVLDHEIRDAFYMEMENTCMSFCLIDTCHSGSMLDLPWHSFDGVIFKPSGEIWNRQIEKPSSYCISACNDNEYAGEDISEYGGWGGKLVCAFLDYVNTYKKVDMKQFFLKVRNSFTSQQRQKSHPIMSKTSFK